MREQDGTKAQNLIDQSPILQVLKTPKVMLDLDIKGWNKLLLEAHLLKLRARIAHDAQEAGLWEDIPEAAQRILINARIDATARQRKILWEVNRIRRALFDFDDKIILVKGVAYLIKDLRCARGRTSVDVDILVDKKNIDKVENFFFLAGYGTHDLNDYDQQYYRKWAHEIPPLIHPNRMIEVDVHHSILQITNRLTPKIDLMITAAVTVEDNIQVLCNEDMLLHSIVHQFVDGAIKGSLRNLLEQHDMIMEFSEDPDFWTSFMSRADELNFGRPVFYCLRYCQIFLSTIIPGNVALWADKYRPNGFILKVMDWMVLGTMVPFGMGRSKLANYIATNGLYIRSHWLRMPPFMLAVHLSRKLIRRLPFVKS